MNLISDELKLKKDPLALMLIGKILELHIEDANIYYNFPLYRGETRDDILQAHVLFVSKSYGIVFFRCLNSIRDLTAEEEKNLDDLDSHIFSKINKIDDLRLQRRELKINVSPFVFINSENIPDGREIINQGLVKDIILANKKVELNDNEFNLLLSVIEGTVYLRRKRDRIIKQTDNLTKGKILNIIQNSLAVFDIDQKRAALNIIDSPQRIRGLAGSGKTIILTMKAALYHLQNADSYILYTYFTKALYGQIKYLIEKYYRDFSDNREPDWKKIHILHGWGGTGLRGVYSETCDENGIRPIKLLEARASEHKDPFNYVCKELESNSLMQKYDLTLIDEGQDFPIYFYRLCRKITKENRIVWAYDDFQNIFDVNIQDEKETFGKNSSGEYYVDFSRNENKLQDIALQKCYRNPRISLITAFSLGLGIYNNKVLQRLENNKHWEDLGFIIEQGDSKDGSEMIISRPVENSPNYSHEYFDDYSIDIKLFNNIDDECTYVSKEILKDIFSEELRADDICVICLDSRSIEAYFNRIETKLVSKGVQVFNLLKAANNNTFFNIENHVTLSTLNKAKGNEVGMVYIVGTDYIFENKDFIIERNKLFTAITRSKGWVKMTGFEKANTCYIEMQKLKKNDFKLCFIQPSKKETKTILRGMTQQQSFLNDINRKLETYAKNSGLTMDELIELLSRTDKSK